MGIIDLKIEHIRASKHWHERHKRLRQLNTTTAPQNSLGRSENPNTSKFHITNGTNDQPMDLELHEAAKNGDIDIFITILEKFSKNTKSPLPTIFSQLTPQQDTFLHVAASYGHEELTGFIAHHFGQLIVWKNCNGDSALHLAARAGHFGLVEILLRFRNDKLYRDSNWDDCLVLTDEERVALIKQRVEERVLVNDEGNTALHEALINDHKDVAEYLMTWNIEAAYYVNKQGKSPLYMAVEAGKIEYVKTMLRGRSGYMTLLAERSKYMDILDKKLTKGKSLLHAAIKERSIDPQQVVDQPSMDLALYVALPTIENQLTPLKNTFLHVAASFGNEDLTGFIVHHFRSLLSKRNHKGDTPLHVAARGGHLCMKP